MTIAVLVSPLAAKAAVSSPAAAQTGAADAAPDADFGALLENHMRSGAAAIEAASDLPAAPAEAEHDDAAAEQGGTSVVQDVAALFATPLQLAPQVTAVVLSVNAVVRDSTRADLLVESSEGDAELPLSGKAAADIAANGKILPLTTSEIAIATRVDVRTAKSAAVDVTGQVRPESLVASPAPHATQAPATLSVEPKVGTPGWDGALGQRVVWMATRQQQVAEMHLNPPNLGPLEVRLTISNDQASAQFVSHHPAVREAIEAALPRLREMLAESGITLGNVQVGSESFAQSRAFDQGDASSSGQGSSLSAQVPEPLHVSAGLLVMPREGRVDTFA